MIMLRFDLEDSVREEFENLKKKADMMYGNLEDAEKLYNSAKRMCELVYRSSISNDVCIQYLDYFIDDVWEKIKICYPDKFYLSVLLRNYWNKEMSLKFNEERTKEIQGGYRTAYVKVRVPRRKINKAI